jgi:hypothetical protein
VSEFFIAANCSQISQISCKKYWISLSPSGGGRWAVQGEVCTGSGQMEIRARVEDAKEEKVSVVFVGGSQMGRMKD